MNLEAKKGAVHRRTLPQTDEAGYITSPTLSLSRKRHHAVIALLPVLEAEETIEHLDEEGPMLTLHLEEEDERRSQPVEAGKSPPAAIKLQPSVSFVALAANENPAAHIRGSSAGSHLVKMEVEGTIAIERLCSGLRKPLSAPELLIQDQRKLGNGEVLPEATTQRIRPSRGRAPPILLHQRRRAISAAARAP